MEPIAGHGALIQVEQDPVGAPGSFTTVGELNGDITWPSLRRPETDVTSHQRTIDKWITGVLSREPMTFGVNYIKDDPTHDAATGLISHILGTTVAARVRGFRLIGPEGAANDDEWIGSGEVTNVGPITHPVREGARTAEVTVRFSGPMKIDGVIYGT